MLNDAWVGIVDPARAHAPGLRRRRQQPVPLPAALAQRGAGGLPVRGLYAEVPRPSERRGASGDLLPLTALGGQFPDRPHQDRPRVRRVRVGDRLPRPHLRQGRAGRAGPRLQERARPTTRRSRRRSGRTVGIPGGLARVDRRRRALAVRAAARARPGPLPPGWTGAAASSAPGGPSPRRPAPQPPRRRARPRQRRPHRPRRPARATAARARAARSRSSSSAWCSSRCRAHRHPAREPADGRSA